MILNVILLKPSKPRILRKMLLRVFRT